MISGFDANCFKDVLYDDRDKTESMSTKAYKIILDQGHIVFDSGNIIESEWMSVAGTELREYASSLIAELAENGKIVLYDTVGCRECKQMLKVQGVPSKDAKILAIVKASEGDYMVTKDIDFFAPKEKKCKERRRRTIMEKRKGVVCKLIQKKYGLQIHMPTTFVDQFT